jgi:transposase InsO family protein
VDSVHQGDLEGEKGLYEINLVDEVTQYEFVAAAEGISERFMVPALEGSIAAFPFLVKGFHVDNGSEYVNHRVAALLNKLHVEEFTKSRPRHSNDNALVESKNASVVARRRRPLPEARRDL